MTTKILWTVLPLLLVVSGCKESEPAARAEPTRTVRAGPSGSAPSAPSLSFEPTPAPLVTASARDPKLVVRASGAIYALIAQRTEEGGHDAVLYRSDDGGDHFGEPIRLNEIPGEVRSHGETAPKLLLGPRSELYAFWVGKGALRLARSLNYGRSFEPPLEVPTGSEDPPSFFNAEVSADGILMIAWLGRLPGEETAPGTSLLVSATSKDRGKTFSAPTVIARDVCPCCRPTVTAGEKGEGFVVWRQVVGEVRDMVAAKTADGGKTWSSPVPVSNDGWKIPGCPHSGAAVALVRDELYVTWYSEAEGRGKLYATKSPTAKLGFGPRRELSRGVHDANHPSLAVSGDEVLAAFQGRDPAERGGWGPLGVYVRSLTGDEPALRVPSGTASASYAEVVPLGAGKWFVAWTATKESGPEILRARARQP